MKRSRRKITHCENCGRLIGTDRGPAAKTCSEECQLERNRAREKARYQRVKDSPAWKETRADYLERVKSRAAIDPEYAKHLAKQRRAAVRKHRASLTPEQLEQYREHRRQWHRDLTPEQRARRKYWYGNLSPELKHFFLLELREKRAYERLKRPGLMKNWNEALTPLLGTMTDKALAEKAGCATHVVAYQRKKLGVPAFSTFHEQVGVMGGKPLRVWTAEEDALLGTNSDLQIAQALGRSPNSVTQRRQRLGVPSKHNDSLASASRHRNSRGIIQINEKMLETLNELHPFLLQRYQAAGLPIHKLEPWQIIEIALNELLHSSRKAARRKPTAENVSEPFP